MPNTELADTGSLPAEPAELLALAQDGNRRALARLMSLVESSGAGSEELAALSFQAVAGSEGRTLAAHTVGITGAPGSGKSSLTSQLITAARERSERVAVLAIDPSSPFSGGAILGDRIRMGEHTSDEGVYIRSMASRGHLGGLSLAAPLAARVLAAAGWSWVLIETVGVGQVEVEIASTADSTIVVVNPGWGDSVQASKAGLLEVADIFVINKSDWPRVAETRTDILQMLELAGDNDWVPPIVETISTTGEGATELWDAIAAHSEHLRAGGDLAQRRRAAAEKEFGKILRQLLAERVAGIETSEAGADIRRQLADGQIDPYSAAKQLIQRALG